MVELESSREKKCCSFYHVHHLDCSLYLHLNRFAWVGGNLFVNGFDELVNVSVDKSSILELGRLKVRPEKGKSR